MDEYCGNCRFGGKEAKNSLIAGDIRLCRRYPPTVVVIDEEEESYFPEIHETDWCGEWQPKPDEAEEWLDKANKRMENKGT